ncbi:hypothetical protein B0H14DRAFT_2596935 [Mycena olivaceomarginata]|nr:hypothetical protein B0H14DRAFT_2596935 [Mycena olivaceomarginata]
MLLRRAQFTHLAPVEGPNYVPRIEVLGGETKKKEAVRRLEEGTLRLLSALRLKEDEIMFTHLAPVEGRNRVRSPDFLANLYPQDEIIVSSTACLQYFILKESSFAELPPISSCLRPSYKPRHRFGKEPAQFPFSRFRARARANRASKIESCTESRAPELVNTFRCTGKEKPRRKRGSAAGEVGGSSGKKTPVYGEAHCDYRELYVRTMIRANGYTRPQSLSHTSARGILGRNSRRVQAAACFVSLFKSGGESAADADTKR